ncbi:SRPBCC family protein [Streptomyces xantholiticus]
MRYADGPATAHDVYIEAAPQAVWELVTDIHLPARLSPELQRAEWLGDVGTPQVGACFAGYNRHPMIGEWRTVSHVLEVAEQRLFRWAVVDADGRYSEQAPDPAHPLATWSFALEAEGSGTRLRQSVRIGPARSGVNLAIDRMPEREEEIVAFRLGELHANIEASLQGIKALAEAERSSP